MNAFDAQATVTRAANTTPYTALDVVGGVIEFKNMGNRVGDHGLITSVELRAHITAVPSGMTDFRLHMYSQTPPSAITDNAAFDLPSGDRAYYLGYMDLVGAIDLGATVFVQANGLNKHYVLGAAETSLYGYLQTIAGFTPAGNSEVYVPRIQAVGL